ncbi:MAG: ATP-binding cassette domain-containing protein [candidate division Zixibacteria bacterium]|nr:ATP-binding cassette domain-containing protein [candidate division Zixibacteria bacterium]
MTTEPIIHLEDVWFSYDGASVLENVSLRIQEREFVWIVGPNGGGKTTLLKLMLGLLKPTAGRVRVLTQTSRQARSRIGYMPQQVSLDPRFPVDVLAGC